MNLAQDMLALVFVLVGAVPLSMARAEGLARTIQCGKMHKTSLDRATPLAEVVFPSVNSKLWARYWDSPEAIALSTAMETSLTGASLRTEINGHGWVLTRGLELEDHLFLDLVHIQTQDHNLQDAKLVGIGGRATGANSMLIKVLTGFLRVIEGHRERHPGKLKTLVVRGVNIKNTMFLKMLEENGFKRNDLHVYSKELEKTIQDPWMGW